MSGKIKLNTSKVILNTDKIVFGTPVKTWVFIETNSNPTAYSPRVLSPIVAGALGCLTVLEADTYLDSNFPASDYSTGDYARVSVFDDEFVGCGTFHWFQVQLV
jgi:hypothetical protein